MEVDSDDSENDQLDGQYRSNYIENSQSSNGAQPPAPVRQDPAFHAYLGDVSEVPHMPLYNEGDLLLIPLLILPNVVLYPGETLPLKMLESSAVQTISRLLSENQPLIAVANDVPPQEDRHLAVRQRRHCASVGTLAEVRQVNIKGVREAVVIAKGKSRFRVQRALMGQQHRTQDHLLTGALVKILHDDPVPEVPPELYRYPKTFKPSTSLKRRRDSRIAYFPLWTYSMFDGQVLATRVQQILLKTKRWKQIEHPEIAMYDEDYGAMYWETCQSSDPKVRGLDIAKFSYWVASNITLEDADRQKLLEVDSSVMRLRMLLSILQREEEGLACSHCSRMLSRSSEVFVMSSEGAIGTYVNPHGIVHQTLTVKTVQQGTIFTVGPMSTESTWFPGYGWRIAYCRCGIHLGWRFDAVEESLSPRYFWGFRRSAIKMCSTTEEEEDRRVEDLHDEDEVLNVQRGEEMNDMEFEVSDDEFSPPSDDDSDEEVTAEDNEEDSIY